MEDIEFLNDKEKSVITSLQKAGRLSATDLSKETLINRTSLYPILDKLKKKGLVSSMQVEGLRYFQSISSADLKEWAKQKYKKLKDNTEDFIQWVDTVDRGTSLITDTQYFQGVEGVQAMYAESWRNNHDKEILALTDYRKAYDSLGKFFNNEYFDRRIKKGIKVKSLTAETASSRRDLKRAEDLLREVRFLDLFQDLGIELNIYDDKVTLTAFDQKEPSSIMIKNEIIARAFKEIYKFLWKHGKKPLK